MGAALALICLLSPKSAAQDASNSDTRSSGKPPLIPAAAAAGASPSPRLRTEIDTARSTDKLYRALSEEGASKTSDAAADADADAAEAATDPKKIK